jgi:hypothetical protein
VTIYSHNDFEYRPKVGERVCFWTGRGSQGYATVRQIRRHPRLQCELFLLAPEPSASRGADYWQRGASSYWGPRDFGVTLDQLEHEPRIWFQNF